MSNESRTQGINATVPTVEDLLVLYLGEKRKDIGSVVVLTVIYAGVFILGIIGNLSTCVVIARSPYMHTVTNYYLFSLAISDLLILIMGLPPELYSIWEAYPWRFGEGFCIFRTFFIEMMSYSSVLTITAFTVERYIAICHPIKAQTLSNLPRAIRIICVIWILAAIFAIPYPVHTRLYHYVPYNGTYLSASLVCNIPLKWLTQMKHVFQMSTFVFFIFPMALISIMYILIGRALSQSDFQPKNNSNDKHSTKTRARNAVIKMLVAVVVAFFCCWAPFNAQRLITSYVSEWTPLLFEIQSTLFYISGVLYYIGATINPLLYNLMSKKYRMAFKRTLCRCCLNVAT
ncbi:pyrokinin-1 receptor-like [Mytilus galloprovincialis]|uniref:pyrokinin-1 receptor-like n=1 Tax=Mytilus galloprovincialis TaxID=29158 RepID=UPI003F7C00BE